MQPRDYQTAAVRSVWSYFMQGGTGNPIVAMPTGSGKSGVCAWVIESMVKAYPATRVLVLTHVKELIRNNYETLMRIWPGAPAGIYSAGLKRKDVGAQITFAGIASIRTRSRLFQGVDVIFIDECHLVSDRDSTSYQTFIATLKMFNPHLKVIGLSATPWRLGMGHLTDGKMFDAVCFDLTAGDAFVWMIEQGYLIRLVPKKTDAEIDVDGVAIRGGEFKGDALDDAITAQGVIARALDEAVIKAADRRRWLVFASSIKHAEEVADGLNARGVKATTVHSNLPDAERDLRLADFKAGKYQAVVNKDILTTGYDDPFIDCIVMLRPTQSPGLWVQMLGRGTRPVFAPGFDLSTQSGRLAAIAASAKTSCLVLDFAGNTSRLGPINYPTLPKKKGAGGGGEPPTRVCPGCGTYVHISIKACPECGYEFPVVSKVVDRAATAELVAEAPVKVVTPPKEYGVFKVDSMVGSVHRKVGRPDSVRVDYYSGVRRFVDYVGLEHVGYMRIKSVRWWGLHSPAAKTPVPKSTADLLEVFGTLRKPSHIKVCLTGKYQEVTEYDFTGTGFAPFGLSGVQRSDGAGGDHPADTGDDHGGEEPRGWPAGDGNTGADHEGAPVSELPDLSDFY